MRVALCVGLSFFIWMMLGFRQDFKNNERLRTQTRRMVKVLNEQTRRRAYALDRLRNGPCQSLVAHRDGKEVLLGIKCGDKFAPAPKGEI